MRSIAGENFNYKNCDKREFILIHSEKMFEK